MSVIVTGSIATDYIMLYPGHFQEHILFDQVGKISVSFLVEDKQMHRGGVGPNISYSLALLGERPRLMGTAGQDFGEYAAWLEAQGVDVSLVRVYPDEFTATFTVITDLDQNQIAGFHAGAMSRARVRVGRASARRRRAGYARPSLVVLAGKMYGAGSSRDWAAKGTKLLGVKAVIAESFERIHRSNLVGMGILPCEFINGETAESLGLTGKESFTITGVAENFSAGKILTVVAQASQPVQRAGKDACSTKEFQVKARVDAPLEIEYLKNGGVLNYVLRNMMQDR